MDARLCIAGLLVAISAASLSADSLRASEQNFLIHYQITPIKQSSVMNCWAATYAMLVSWRNKERMSERAAIAPLGSPWIAYLAEDTGLPGGKEREFVAKAGLMAEPPADYTLEGFLYMLRTFGPLWIITGDGISSHARLMVAAFGGGTYDNTYFVFVDPFDGQERSIAVLSFYPEYEREAGVVVRMNDTQDLRWQIIHWPRE